MAPSSHDGSYWIRKEDNVTSMTDITPPTIQWLHPWAPCEPGPGLEVELAREVGPGHVLAGRRTVSIGRRVDNDDVLFWLPDSPSPFAVVHLTWTGRREIKPEWPLTDLYASLESWIEQRMRPDHLDPDLNR